jgi:hypothetical protein
MLSSFPDMQVEVEVEEAVPVELEQQAFPSGQIPLSPSSPQECQATLLTASKVRTVANPTNFILLLFLYEVVGK